MTAPTFVDELETSWTNSGSGTPKTLSVTTAVGDVLVISSGSEGANVTLSAVSGGTGTYVNQENIGVSGTDARAKIDTAITGITAQTFTMSETMTGVTASWGYNVARFSGATGFGAHSSTVSTGGPSLGITTTQDSSAIVVVAVDFNAVDGSTRTWRTVNGTAPSAGNGFELTYFRNASSYTVYIAYYPDAGAAGAKTVGLSAPTGQRASIAAVEVQGTASAAPYRPTILTVPCLAAVQAGSW
jgi:hypothetical protein